MLSTQGYDLEDLIKSEIAGITGMIIKFQTDAISKSCKNCKAESIVDQWPA